MKRTCTPAVPTPHPPRSDAAAGCLRGGDCGVVVEVDGTSAPFQVRSLESGAVWWFERLALCFYPRPGQTVTLQNARPGFGVVRGRDWSW